MVICYFCHLCMNKKWIQKFSSIKYGCIICLLIDGVKAESQVKAHYRKSTLHLFSIVVSNISFRSHFLYSRIYSYLNIWFVWLSVENFRIGVIIVTNGSGVKNEDELYKKRRQVRSWWRGRQRLIICVRKEEKKQIDWS